MRDRNAFHMISMAEKKRLIKKDKKFFNGLFITTKIYLLLYFIILNKDFDEDLDDDNLD